MKLLTVFLDDFSFLTTLDYQMLWLDKGAPIDAAIGIELVIDAGQ